MVIDKSSFVPPPEDPSEWAWISEEGAVGHPCGDYVLMIGPDRDGSVMWTICETVPDDWDGRCVTSQTQA